MEFVIGMQADGNLYKWMKLVSKGVVPLVNGLVCVAIGMNLSMIIIGSKLNTSFICSMLDGSLKVFH
jgi:hypothetical protein